MPKLNLSPIPEGDPEHMTTGPEPVLPGQTLPPGQSLKSYDVPQTPGGFQPKSIRVGPIDIQNYNLPPEGARTRWAEDDKLIAQVYNEITRNLNWFHAMIEPRLDKLGTGGEQGAAYALPNEFYWLSKLRPDLALDPAVETWFSQFGGIATGMNKIYSSGRPSSLGFQTMTEPHIPIPPKPGFASAKNAMSEVNFRKYVENLENARDTLELMMGKKPKSYAPITKDWVPGATPGLWYNPKTDEWRTVVP